MKRKKHKNKSVASIVYFQATSWCSDCGKALGYISTLAYTKVPANMLLPDMCKCKWVEITSRLSLDGDGKPQLFMVCNEVKA